MAWWDNKFGADQRGRVPVEKLAFDTSNPRFTPEKKPKNNTEAAVIQHLDRTADLGELIQSIAASGYIDIEPLIVIARDDELVVLEGNRRLAALKVLLSPALATEANVSVPDVSAAHRLTLKEVTAFKVNREEDARELIGFKHINGPQGWDAYAKALFAARWLDEQADKGDDAIPLTEIAARMGDKHDTLYRIVSAIYVLQQAESEGLWRVDDRVGRNFSFSHLYTALTYSEYRNFIGLPSADRTADPPKNPVQTDYFPQLRQLLIWLYGSKSQDIRPAIRTQAPDLSLLKRVLGHATARRLMIERGNLAEALEQTVPSEDRFEKALFDAHAALKIATAELASSRADSELVQISEEIRDRAELIAQTLAERRSTERRSTPKPTSR